MKLSRLWQPRRPQFWMMVAFNGLSSVMTWAMQALPLSTIGLVVVGALALGNVACGMVIAWQLVRDEPPPPAA